MRRDPCTGLYYPYYSVTQELWNPKAESYDGTRIADVQTYEEALSILKNTTVNRDLFQLEIIENYEEYSEVIAEKVATDDSKGYFFWNPQTEEELD